MVARRLRFRYVDDGIVLIAAEKAGVSPGEVVAAEQSRSLIGRVVDVITTWAPVDPTGATVRRRIANPPPPRYETQIFQAICDVADEGRAVIVAHGASVALAGRKGLLRVLVTASPETRAQRLMRTAQMSEREAGKSIAKSDRARSDYLSRFYKVKEEQPSHYDLVINTDVLDLEQAADLVVTAAGG